MKNNQFWFILEPYVSVNIKKNDALVYNTLNGKEVLYLDNPEISRFLKNMMTGKNLMSMKISEKVLKNNKTISKLTNELRNTFMGDIIEDTFISEKPFQFPPRIKIIDEDIHQERSIAMLGKDVMHNLSEISLYINNQCNLNCTLCDYAYKLFLFCCKGKGGRGGLKFVEICNLIDEARGSSLKKINILGGNIFLYGHIKKLISFLNDIKPFKSYFIHYRNLRHQDDKLRLMDIKLSELNILITFPIDEYILKKTLVQARSFRMKTNLVFSISKTREIEISEKIAKLCNIDNISLNPCYNGRNLMFFKKNVFLRKKQILEAKPSINNILKRSFLNPLFFGRLVVLSNGKVYANVNAPSIGKLWKDSLYKIVYREMERGHSWRKLRKHVNPCRRCVYENLCPPLSNYELALGKNNLCHVYK